MTFHNNKLREIPLYQGCEDDRTHGAPGDISRTNSSTSRQALGNNSFVKEEDSPESRKRKHDEALCDEDFKFQHHHDPSAVEATWAASMEAIDATDQFPPFNYTSANAYTDYRDDTFHDSGTGGMLHGYKMPHSSGLARTLSFDTLSGDILVPESFTAGSHAVGSYAASGATYPDAADGGRAYLKHEDAHDSYTVSATPADESDFAVSESEDERPRKVPKINKDGAPRKPRQPRAKLLKWNDDDWKNVCLGIVWACGEIGVQIPFDQAAQVVGEKCTAGALQQALLKLRAKQIAEGYQIPNLKMAWTRKNKYAASTNARAKSSQEPVANRPYKKPTRMEGTQSHIVTLSRAYKEHDRQGMVYPYKWRKPMRKVKSGTLRSSAGTKHKGLAGRSTPSSGFLNDAQRHQNDLGAFPYSQPEAAQVSQPSFRAQAHHRGNVLRGNGTLTPNPAGGIQGDAAVYDFANGSTGDSSPVLHYFDSPNNQLVLSDGGAHVPLTPSASQNLSDFLPATPTLAGRQQYYQSPPVTPWGNNIGYPQGMAIGHGEIFTTEDLQDFGNGFSNATEDIFTI